MSAAPAWYRVDVKSLRAATVASGAGDTVATFLLALYAAAG